jgi:ABC-type dipeptide/oligopeptide/nickel transport system permease component
VIRLVSSRLLGMAIAIIGASFLAFAFMRILPGNPARLILGPLVPQTSVNQLAHDMGLDRPIPTQYFRYMRDFIAGDWGFSYSTGLDVRTVIWQRLPATLEVDLYAFVLSTSFAFVAAIAATYRRRPLLDRLVRWVSYVGLGTPPFWLGLLLLVLLSSHAHVLPGPDGRLSPTASPPPHHTGFYTIDSLLAGQFGTFWDALRHLILPAATLGFILFSVLARLLRANLLGVEREHFLLVVKSKGVAPWPAFVRHAVPNAVLPTLTAAGLLLAELLTGSVLVERVFNWPGVGGLVVDSIQRKDYAIVQTFILLSALAYVVVNAIVDLAYILIDPRTRLPAAAT